MCSGELVDPGDVIPEQVDSQKGDIVIDESAGLWAFPDEVLARLRDLLPDPAPMLKANSKEDWETFLIKQKSFINKIFIDKSNKLIKNLEKLLHLLP